MTQRKIFVDLADKVGDTVNRATVNRTGRYYSVKWRRKIGPGGRFFVDRFEWIHNLSTERFSSRLGFAFS